MYSKKKKIFMTYVEHATKHVTQMKEVQSSMIMNGYETWIIYNAMIGIMFLVYIGLWMCIRNMCVVVCGLCKKV
jgi:hypothetical protein